MWVIQSGNFYYCEEIDYYVGARNKESLPTLYQGQIVANHIAEKTGGKVVPAPASIIETHLMVLQDYLISLVKRS